MSWKYACAAILFLAAPGTAQEPDAETRARVARDLLTVITMEGRPCGEVVEAERHSEQDYTATCKTGDRYRVRIVEERVRIEPL